MGVQYGSEIITFKIWLFVMVSLENITFFVSDFILAFVIVLFDSYPSNLPPLCTIMQYVQRVSMVQKSGHRIGGESKLICVKIVLCAQWEKKQGS